jgi:predicted phage terminase large subunit-like protein
VGTGIPGLGANLLIIDDPIAGPDKAMSDTQRDKQWDWWQTSAFPRLAPGSAVIVIATRWHEDDLSGRLIRAGATGDGIPVRRLHLPAIAEDGDELRRNPGEALWPDQWPINRLELLKGSKSIAWWNALYQQRPGRHEGAEWPDDYFGEHLWESTWPDTFDLRAVAIDPSKGRERGDFSAIVFAGLSGGKVWIDASIERRPPEQIVRDAIRFSREHQPMAVSLEANQWQDLLAPEFDRQCAEQNTMPLPICLLENRENKELRIGRLGPYLMRKQLRFRDTPGCKRLVQQLREFPLSDHDDGPDALEMAIRKLLELCQPADDSDGGYDYASA